MKGGAIPLPGSHESVTRQPRDNKRDETDTGTHKGDISYNTSKHHTGHVSGLYL